MNAAEAATCCFCDTRLSQKPADIAVSTPFAAPTRPATDGNLALAPDWRNEVASRLKAYRARHGRPEDPSQPELVFDAVDNNVAPAETDLGEEPAAAPIAELPAKVKELEPQTPVSAQVPVRRWGNADRPRAEMTATPAASAPGAIPDGARRGVERTAASRPSLDRLEIDVAQPSFDFRDGSRVGDDRWDADQRNLDRPWRESLESRIYPVATLEQRRVAGLLDAALLLFSYGAFLSLFVVLGGRFAFSKVDAAIAGATLGLFYALYVALFTFFGGTTPGMMLRHLRVVSFDGSDPTPGQLLWRSFGYLVSAGTLLFGFLAALWDDDTLCWHDRISQTYLTDDSADPASASDRRD